jgi:phosphatidylserine synthase
LRLGRFNVDTRPREFFWGLATPSGSILVIALGWDINTNGYLLIHPGLLQVLSWFVPIFLMIMYQAPLKLPGLKSPKSGLWTLIVIAVLTVVGLFVLGPIAISLGIFLYVMAGVVNLVIRWY